MKRKIEMKYKGFTLIELLVVVLIIGILSAIAIPQYQRAVQRARLSEVYVMLRALRTASDAYYLANNTRPLDFTQLDITFPVKEYQTYEGVDNAEITLNNGSDFYLDVDGYMAGRVINVPVQIEYDWNQDLYRCRVFVPLTNTTHPGHALCKSLGGVYYTEGSGSTFYKLPL